MTTCVWAIIFRCVGVTETFDQIFLLSQELQLFLLQLLQALKFESTASDQRHISERLRAPEQGDKPAATPQPSSSTARTNARRIHDPSLLGT